MSTPSTATAFALHNNPFPPYNKYGPASSPFCPQPNIETYIDLPPTLLSNAPPSSSASTNSSNSAGALSIMASRSQAPPKRTRKRTPDWEEFYRNGPPREIIVIDDTPPPQPGGSSGVNGRGRQLPAPASASRVAATNGHHYSSATNNNAASGSSQNSRYHGHQDKKRKMTAASQYYEPFESSFTNEPQHSYSSTHTPHTNGAYGSPTVSAHSGTVDLHTGNSTTAGTSLGSNAGAASHNYAAPTVASGQKRKRVTRAAAAVAAGIDALSHYCPPPKPPIKAKDVFVQPVPDTRQPHGGRVDDDDGHYIITPDTDLTPRYRITKLLGQGTFGKVVEAYDKIKKTKCAIKVIRSVQKYRDASRIELRVLSTLSSNDRENRNRCIHLRDCFDYRNHICIVTDLLGMSVFDFLKGNGFAPFPNSNIQSFARQLLTSVAFLHDLNLIHTDLKPENILLVHNEYQTYNYNKPIPSSSTTTQRTGRTRRVLLDTEIRLIDFGSATFDDEYHSSVVSTRHYRAPEIILGLGWSFPCDLWSIGCILVEFYTGDALFQTHDNLEHLAMMQEVCGPKIDMKLVRSIATRNQSQISNANKYFRSSRLEYPNNETSRSSKKYVAAMKHLNDIIPATSPFNKQFLDLLKKIFVYDPSKRITALEALRHPWFREHVQDEGTEAAKVKLNAGTGNTTSSHGHKDGERY